ncbi:chemotaxis protein CheA [Donghicola sp. XS_ASV15]|uniref:chemotaxis protein CheA n=1 Tax=Donghicola sp. XS_ASV15 TaxID=3241295 RepID=UPI0035135110
MNALLAQFVAESRDLIEAASKSLLDLEQNAEDKEQIDQLFRAVHTIKGAAGLFEFSPLTKTVHAGEDLLDTIRAGDVPFTSDVADVLLEMLDRCVDWLDQVEAQEALNDDAEAIGNALSQRLRALIDAPGIGAIPELSEAAPEDTALPWPEDVPALPVAGAVTLVTYTPSENAFFSGDDPLRTVQSTPGLVWSKIVPPKAWPASDDLDPFLLHIGFRLVSTAPQDELEAHFSYVSDEVTYEVIVSAGEGSTEGAIDEGLRAMAEQLLVSQRSLLASDQASPAEDHCTASVAVVLQRVAQAVSIELTPELDSDNPRATIEQWMTLLGAALRKPEPKAAPVQTVEEEPAEEPETAKQTASPTRANSHLRVSSERIDALMNLAGELIVAKNAMPFLAQKAETMDETGELVREIKAQHNTINRISEELQSAIMQIRMVPMSTILSRFNRLVRDMSRKLGKEIQYVVEGEDTEADKAIVDELAEPIVHLIRNSIDHGLEDPVTREASDKPRVGTIRVKAYQLEESVVLEVLDDGKGIDVDAVIAKALERGLVDQDKVNNMAPADALQLVFLPGLSTKNEVSDLSGRGVGMDAVASMVRRIGGNISIFSEKGRGTKITMKLPLSMAVQRLMMVEIGDGLYGVPIDRVVESQKIKSSSIRRHRNAEMVVLRDRLIPLVRMRSLFACPDVEDNDILSVMVVDVDGRESGLIVDKFHPGVDAIIKPMTGVLSSYQCYSGTALLGDGSILLALNLSEIIECQYH